MGSFACHGIDSSHATTVKGLRDRLKVRERGLRMNKHSFRGTNPDPGSRPRFIAANHPIVFNNHILPQEVSPDATERRWEREAMERMRREPPGERYRPGRFSWRGAAIAVVAAVAIGWLTVVGVMAAVR